MSWAGYRSGRQRNVFKGSDLVSALQERNPRRFRSRTAAYRFARKLFREGVIKSIFGASYFEDSAQLYMWQNDDLHPWRNMTSQSSASRNQQEQLKSSSDTGLEYPRDYRLISDVRNRIRKEEDNINLVNSIFRDIEREIEETKNIKFADSKQPRAPSWSNQRQSTSSESSVDVSSVPVLRRRGRNPYTVNMTNLRDHDAIPEESQERTSSVSMEYDLNNRVSPGAPPHALSPVGVGETSPRRWQDSQCPYSDNEKQLLDEMKKMKREHQTVLNTYEERINKLMAKMHELRSIAEMLENSSNKSSPYGILPKTNLLHLIGAKINQERTNTSGHDPPPLPPRPGRGVVIYPNKPMIQPRVRMKQLVWSRIIMKDIGTDASDTSIWEMMVEPKIATEELENYIYSVYGSINEEQPQYHKDKTQSSWREQTKEQKMNTNLTHGEKARSGVPGGRASLDLDAAPVVNSSGQIRLFSATDVALGEGTTLFDDITQRRGRIRQQLITVFDIEMSRRIMYSMRMLRCKLHDIVSILSSMDNSTSGINQDGLAELLESLGTSKSMEKVIHYVRRNGSALLEHPEYLVFELSKVDHFRERIAFLSFRYRLEWQLFEIDQQMREVYTACEEIINSAALKNLLETLLAVGNYLNGGTQHGQADGYGLDILNTLKDIQDRDAKGNMLEFVLKMYCQYYEAEVEIGCPTRFRLPEASNMRHAAQVSFDGIQDRLNNLQSELKSTRNRLLDSLGKKDDTDAPSGLGTQMENFYTSAVEVMSEQEKLLTETRDVFSKTTSFFMHDPKCTSQEFFQIWATFLHDCKYYWRLAHRKLAKDRFEHDFRYKGQMSSSSVTGFGNMRCSLIRRISSLRRQGDPRLNREQQLRQVDRWVESCGQPTSSDVEQPPTSQPKQKDVPKVEQLVSEPFGHVNKCPSPKPFTSLPPNGTVLHRPMPKQATSPSSAEIPRLPPNHNYENYNDLRASTSPERLDTLHEKKEVNQRRAQVPLPSAEQTSKKPAQFSLKSWLKREQNRRTSNIDKTPEGPDQNKNKPVTGTLSKFRNTVMNRFSGNNDTQRGIDHRARVDKWNTQEQGMATDSNAKQQDTPGNDVPHVGQFQEMTGNDRAFNHIKVSGGLNRPVRSRNRSSSESPGRSSASRADSRHSGDRMQPNSPPQQTSYQPLSKSQDFFNIPEAQSRQSPQNDMNNNTQPTALLEQSNSRNRAPVVLSSQVNLLDEYALNNAVEQQQQGKDYSTRGSEAKLSKANAVPVYKARIIHNYENQTKWDIPMAKKQQVEAVHGGSTNESHISHTTGIHSTKVPTKFITSSSDQYSHRNPGNMQIDKLQKDMRSNLSTAVYSGNNGRVKRDRQIVEANENGKPIDNREKSSSGPRAVTSLIERFELSKAASGNQQKLYSHNEADFQEKHVAMTSTPVTHRKELSLPPDNESVPPLPPRGDSQNPFPLLESIPTKASPAYGSAHQTPPNPQSRANQYGSSQPANLTKRNILGNTHFNSAAINASYTTPVSGNSVSGSNFYGQLPYSTDYSSQTPSNKNSSLFQNSNFNTPSGNQNFTSSGTNFKSPNGSEKFVSPIGNSTYNSPEYYSDNNRNVDSSHQEDGYRAQLRKAASSSKMDRYMKPSSSQGRLSNTGRSPPGPMAVVKPTVMQKGELTFMEI